MRSIIILFAFLTAGFFLHAQVKYDSISLSRFLITDETLGANWQDTLKSGHYPNYLTDEITIWIKPAKATTVLPPVISLANRIKANGTADIAKCFIPRHSINYYKSGKIVRYLLVCFECDGARFSDDPLNTFVKSVGTREKQMMELKEIFKDLL